MRFVHRREGHFDAVAASLTLVLIRLNGGIRVLEFAAEMHSP